MSLRLLKIHYDDGSYCFYQQQRQSPICHRNRLLIKKHFGKPKFTSFILFSKISQLPVRKIYVGQTAHAAEQF